MDKKIQQRNNKIVKLHEKGKTQQYIATTLGLTRQRIQQIETKLGLVRSKDSRFKLYTLTCHYSGVQFQSRNKNQKFATREDFYLSRRKYKTTEELAAQKELKREKNRQKARWYYYNVLKQRPDFKEIIKQRNQQYGKQSSY